MRGLVMAFALLVVAASARAEVPRVLTDIAPVHSLTAQVMGALGAPELLLTPQEDAHQFQMRPSQARMLARADLVIWMGETMTPWLADAVETLGRGAISLELLEQHDLPMLIMGDMALLNLPEEARDLDGGSGGQAGHGARPGADTGHDHGGTDPHAWLDPENARAFLGAIAEALAAADPENAAVYRANAEAARARIAAMQGDIAALLVPVRQVTLVPYHDAYRYFLIRFDLNVSGALADSEATTPSAARLAEIRDVLSHAGQYCVFSEPGANPEIIRAVLPDPGHKIARLDPLGAGIAPGPGLYEAMMRQMAETIAGCAGDGR